MMSNLQIKDRLPNVSLILFKWGLVFIGDPQGLRGVRRNGAIPILNTLPANTYITPLTFLNRISCNIK